MLLPDGDREAEEIDDFLIFKELCFRDPLDFRKEALQDDREVFHGVVLADFAWSDVVFYSKTCGGIPRIPAQNNELFVRVRRSIVLMLHPDRPATT